MQDLRVALPVLNSAIDVGTPILARTPAMNRDLREVLVELDDLVAQSSTALSFQRLRDTFDSARRFSEWFVPAQTVCNYWNYWFTFLPEALSDRDQVGYSFRQALTNAPLGPVSVHAGPATITVPGETHGPVAGYSGIQATGQHGPLPNPADDGVFEPEAQPTVHGNPFGPTGQKDARLPGRPDRLLPRPPADPRPAGVEPERGRRRHPRLARPDHALLRRGRDPAGRLGCSRVP